MAIISSNFSETPIAQILLTCLKIVPQLTGALFIFFFLIFFFSLCFIVCSFCCCFQCHSSFLLQHLIYKCYTVYFFSDIIVIISECLIWVFVIFFCCLISSVFSLGSKIYEAQFNNCFNPCLIMLSSF